MTQDLVPIPPADFAELLEADESVRKAWRAQTNLRIAVIQKRLTEISTHPRHLRRHTRQQIKKWITFLKAFGFVLPILIDVRGVIIIGEPLWHAAAKLGLEFAPTILVEHLSEAAVRALRIAYDRLSEEGGWNPSELAIEFKELLELELDFDIESTGFSMGEIDFLIETNINAFSSISDGELPRVAATAVCRLGDLYLLGKHRIYCASALSLESFVALLGVELAAMVITDPPYNVKIQGHVSGSRRYREFAMAVGDMSRAEFKDFLQKVCELMIRHVVDGALVYIFMDWRHLDELLDAGRAVFTMLKNICVWVKDRAGMGSHYRSQHEFVLVFKAGTAPHQNNIQLGANGRNRSNVWNYPSVNSFGRSAEEGDPQRLHPTVKPVAMIADAILDSTRRGDIVLDAFLGSGTTLIAAERTGRRCYGLELDPLYVDLAIRRWQAHTGEHAIHAASGKTFKEIEENSDDESKS